LQHKPAFDRSVCAFVYNRDFADILARFKESGDHHAGRVLSEILLESITNENAQTRIDAIVPVPMHWSRYWSRNFNHSKHIAKHLGRALKRPIYCKVKKTDRTKDQKKLNKQQREGNLESSFLVQDKEIAYKRLAIVDDVITTGATANMLSRFLKQAGADYIEVWALARTATKGMSLTER
jgi:ComF family protein